MSLEKRVYKRCPPGAEPCTKCDGYGGWYDAGEGMEWDCDACWGHGTRVMQLEAAAARIQGEAP